MTHRFADIMFTDSVKSAQQRFGSREHNEKFAEQAGPNEELTEQEVTFIAARDSFYMATVNEDGWPYVQHRGGPPGFLKVIGPNRVAFGDFRGNTQLVSVGNVSANDRVSLILMDYPNRRRLKLLGYMKVEDARDMQPEELAALRTEKYRGLIERVTSIDVVAFDWNCPQHITRRYTESEFGELNSSLLEPRI
jgi:predicted pyridoxine 5'-phosphate oxidase superfamily flavin-nucleotide-binding protein